MSDPKKQTFVMAPMAGGQGCEVFGSQEICVSTDVTITPSAVCGTPTVTCVGPAVIGACPGTPVTTPCVFTISQNLCVSIPVTFDALAVCENERWVCGTAFPDATCGVTQGGAGA